MKYIIYPNSSGGVVVCVPTGEVPLQTVIENDIPAGAPYEVVTEEAFPKDRLFRNGWVKQGKLLVEDLERCRALAHQYRRNMRSADLEPYDTVIARRIPGEELTAEVARQAIRDQYAVMQDEIDKAQTVDELRAVLGPNPNRAGV